MSSNEVQSLKISPTLSPQSHHENVKIGGQESKQEQRLLNVQSEDVAGAWTEALGKRATRLNNRKKALNQSAEEKFVTPSPLVTVKGFIPSLTTDRKGSAHFKAIAQFRSAKEAKSQQEFAALQTQVVTLTTTLNSMMAMLQTLTKTIPQEPSMKGDTPQILLSPLSSPISKVSFKDALGSKTPSPTKSDGGKSTNSSNHVDSNASSPRESAASGSMHGGNTTFSPSCDGSPKGKLPASPKRSPPVVTPATVVKKSNSAPSPSTPTPVPASAPAHDPLPAAKTAKKPKPTKSPPKSSSSSSDDSGSSDSTPDRKARRKARRKEIKAERLTRSLSANYQLVKSVTDKFPKLGVANYDHWRRLWGGELDTLSMSKLHMSIDGEKWDEKKEDSSDTVQRKNLAKMVVRTIDSSEHELWLRDTDKTIPQAIFRRMHLKFRGADNIAVSSQIESQLLMMSMKSTRYDVTAYGTAIIENLRKLTEMGTPMCEVKMVTLYLLGLHKNFDPIRFEIQNLIKKKKPKAPKTMSDAKKMVEDWAIQFKDRGLLTFKDTTGADPKSTVLTFAVDVKKVVVDPEACGGWLRYGNCKRNELGTCRFKHDMKKKGINAPSAAVLAAAKTSAPTAGRVPRDYTNHKCEVCKTTGHSQNWANCPTKLAAKKVMHLQPAPAAPIAAVPSSSSKTPSILPLHDTMTVSERALHGYNNKLLKILNVFANQANQQHGSTYPSSNPLMDPVAMMQAFSGQDDD